MPSKIQKFDEFALEKYFSSANSFVSLANKIKRKLEDSNVFSFSMKKSQLLSKEKRYQIEIFIQNTEDGNNFRIFCELIKGKATPEEEISYWAHQDSTYQKTWVEPDGNFSILFTEGSPYLSLIRMWVILKLKKMGIFEDIIMRNDPQQRGRVISKHSGII